MVSGGASLGALSAHTDARDNTITHFVVNVVEELRVEGHRNELRRVDEQCLEKVTVTAHAVVALIASESARKPGTWDPGQLNHAGLTLHHELFAD